MSGYFSRNSMPHSVLQHCGFADTQCVCLTGLPAAKIFVLPKIYGSSWGGESDNVDHGLLTNWSLVCVTFNALNLSKEEEGCEGYHTFNKNVSANRLCHNNCKRWCLLQLSCLRTKSCLLHHLYSVLKSIMCSICSRLEVKCFICYSCSVVYQD